LPFFDTKKKQPVGQEKKSMRNIRFGILVALIAVLGFSARAQDNSTDLPPMAGSAPMENSMPADNVAPTDDNAVIEGLPDLPVDTGTADQTPTVQDNEPLATDQPWGTAVPETAPAPSDELISLNMRGVDVIEVLRVMFKSAGYNFRVDPDVAGKVTIVLENFPFNAALRAVLEQVGATFVKEEGMYHITSDANIKVGGVNAVGIPQTPKRLRIVEVRFADSEEMARIFGGKASGSTYLYGGFESESGSGGGNSSRSSGSSSRSSGSSSRSSGNSGGGSGNASGPRR